MWARRVLFAKYRTIAQAMGFLLGDASVSGCAGGAICYLSVTSETPFGAWRPRKTPTSALALALWTL